ncbi:hypothetical protein Tco_1424821 [Tanacetum coccineum]
MGALWCLFDLTPSGWCKTDAHFTDFVDYAAGGRLRKMIPEKEWTTIEELAQYEEERWNDPIFPKNGSLNYENANIELVLEIMECQVDMLIKDAISLIGKSETLCGLSSNEIRQLPLEPSHQPCAYSRKQNMIIKSLLMYQIVYTLYSIPEYTIWTL